MQQLYEISCRYLTEDIYMQTKLIIFI